MNGRIERIFKPISELDAEIRTIEAPTKEFPEWTVEIGLYESLGEQGGDILTEFYKEYPTDDEIRASTRQTLKDNEEKLNGGLLSGREESQLKVLKRLKQEGRI
jgi:hypothetical protein